MFSRRCTRDVVERPAGACVGDERRRNEMCVDVDRSSNVNAGRKASGLRPDELRRLEQQRAVHAVRVNEARGVADQLLESAVAHVAVRRRAVPALW